MFEKAEQRVDLEKKLHATGLAAEEVHALVERELDAQAHTEKKQRQFKEYIGVAAAAVKGSASTPDGKRRKRRGSMLVTASPKFSSRKKRDSHSSTRLVFMEEDNASDSGSDADSNTSGELLARLSSFYSNDERRAAMKNVLDTHGDLDEDKIERLLQKRMLQRESLRFAPEVRALQTELWIAARVEGNSKAARCAQKHRRASKVAPLSGIPRGRYIEIMVKLGQILTPRFNADELVEMVEGEWEIESGGLDYMDRLHFNTAIFQLASAFTAHPKVEEYTTFLRKCCEIVESSKWVTTGIVFAEGDEAEDNEVAEDDDEEFSAEESGMFAEEGDGGEDGDADDENANGTVGENDSDTALKKKEGRDARRRKLRMRKRGSGDDTPDVDHQQAAAADKVPSLARHFDQRSSASPGDGAATRAARELIDATNGRIADGVIRETSIKGAEWHNSRRADMLVTESSRHAVRNSDSLSNGRKEATRSDATSSTFVAPPLVADSSGINEASASNLESMQKPGIKFGNDSYTIGGGGSGSPGEDGMSGRSARVRRGTIGSARFSSRLRRASVFAAVRRDSLRTRSSPRSQGSPHSGLLGTPPRAEEYEGNLEKMRRALLSESGHGVEKQHLYRTPPVSSAAANSGGSDEQQHIDATPNASHPRSAGSSSTSARSHTPDNSGPETKTGINDDARADDIGDAALVDSRDVHATAAATQPSNSLSPSNLREVQHRSTAAVAAAVADRYDDAAQDVSVHEVTRAGTAPTRGPATTKATSSTPKSARRRRAKTVTTKGRRPLPLNFLAPGAQSKRGMEREKAPLVFFPALVREMGGEVKKMRAVAQSGFLLNQHSRAGTADRRRRRCPEVPLLERDDDASQLTLAGFTTGTPLARESTLISSLINMRARVPVRDVPPSTPKPTLSLLLSGEHDTSTLRTHVHRDGRGQQRKEQHAKAVARFYGFNDATSARTMARRSDDGGSGEQAQQQWKARSIYAYSAEALHKAEGDARRIERLGGGVAKRGRSSRSAMPTEADRVRLLMRRRGTPQRVQRPHTAAAADAALTGALPAACAASLSQRPVQFGAPRRARGHARPQTAGALRSPPRAARPATPLIAGSVRAKLRPWSLGDAPPACTRNAEKVALQSDLLRDLKETSDAVADVSFATNAGVHRRERIERAAELSWWRAVEHFSEAEEEEEEGEAQQTKTKSKREWGLRSRSPHLKVGGRRRSLTRPATVGILRRPSLPETPVLASPSLWLPESLSALRGGGLM